jgi:autotransporter-associated beta strand protein
MQNNPMKTANSRRIFSTLANITLKTTASFGILLAVLLAAPAAFAAADTWNGGGGSPYNWSVGANWGGTAPNATGDTLTFSGTTGLANNNDKVTALATSGTALTFASGAGSFVLSGNVITMGSGGGGGQVIIQQNSANNQEIAFPITLSGGNGDRQIVFGSGAGSLTLSGVINFGTGANADWLFPTTTAGTIILSGNNTGDGKGTAAITAGVNTMKAMMRNNIAATQVTLGSDTCLGNSGSGSVSAGTASFRGIIANAQLNINTTGGNRNLSGNTLAINANNITFNGANNLSIGDIIVVGGNRDFVVSSSGQVTVADGICLSSDQTGRNLYLNLSGAGGMIVNGKIFDTFHSGGLTTAGSGTFRKAGTGTLTLNGASSYADTTSVEGGTLVFGNASAIGTGPLTLAGGNLDSSVANLVNANNNVQNWNSDFTFVGSQNLNLGTGTVTPSANRQVTVSANTLTVGGVIGGGAIVLTKAGGGTLRLNGNNTYSGGAIISAGTLQVGHANALGTGSSTVNGGTLDFSGFSVANTVNVTGSSTLANSSGTAGGLSADANLTADLAVNSTGDISATRFIGTGAIRTVTKSGAGTLTTSGTSHNNLTAWQINQGTVVFANTSGYGADRGVTISGGTLKLSGANFDLINDGQSFTVNSGVFDLNGKNEAVASIGGTGGLIHNGVSSTASTLYVGGGSGGTSSAAFAGVIENGSGTLALTKEGSGTQTLTGINTFTGNTTISAGTLALSGSGSINNSANISIAAGARFDVSGLSSTFALGAGHTLTGSGGTGIIAGNVNLSAGALGLNYANGTPSLNVTNGTLSFNGNAVTVNVSGSLPHGIYKLISTNSAGLVAGTLPAAVTVTGIGTSVGSLSLSNSELYLTVNHPPVANPNSYSRNGLSSWKIAISDLLTNATDADGDTLTLAGLGGSTNGITLSIITNAPGYVAYNNTNLVNDQFSYTVTDGYGGTNTAVITLTAGSVSGVGGQVSSVAFTNGTASMSFAGIPGYKYNVQVSTNLNDWSTLLTTNAPANGLFQFHDGAAPTPAAFYRLMWNGN